MKAEEFSFFLPPLNVGKSGLVWREGEISVVGVAPEILNYLFAHDHRRGLPRYRCSRFKRRAGGEFAAQYRYRDHVYEIGVDGGGMNVRSVTLIGRLEIADDDGNERLVDLVAERQAAEFTMKTESAPDWGCW